MYIEYHSNNMQGTVFNLLFSLLIGLPNVFGLYWDISRTSWLQLEDLQGYICALTVGYQDKNYTRGIPWFCVPPGNCTMKLESLPTKLIGSEPKNACNALRFNEGHDTCCYIDRLSPPLDVDPDDYSTFLYVKGKSLEGDLTSLNEYKVQLFWENSAEAQRDVLEDHEVCAVIPTGKMKSTTLYDIYICLEEPQCKKKHSFGAPLLSGDLGDLFCSKGSYSGRTKCCHMSALLEPSQTPYNWGHKELLPHQKYAPGFKTTFMCEQYNRFVCDGKRDRCPLRILERYTSVPGEFPHQALIGVASHRIQFFHCAGSLVSKYFILSAYGCKNFEGLDASIALLGDYNITQRNEHLSNEQIIYINAHYTDYIDHTLLLLRLWRPAKLNYLVRPACVAFVVKKTEFHAQHDDFGSGWLTGYGPTSKMGKFNETLKRYEFNYLTSLIDLKKCNTKPFPTVTEKSHLCIENGILFTTNSTSTSKDIANGGKIEGYYDIGAPFNVLNSYCQWNVYGIAIENPAYRDNTHTALLIETVSRANKWIESVVWRDDFDFLGFNMTLPDCADESRFNFYNMYYLKREYSQFYNYA